MVKGFILLSIIILILVTLGGCIQEGVGTLVLQITDAPSDLNITKALVNISQIQVHLIASGWNTIIEETQTFDLVAIKDVKEFLGEVKLNAGYYTQIRLQVDSALVTIDEVDYNLKIPPKKINLISPFQIETNKTTTLTLDFDVQESVHAAGKDKYIMNPVIKVIQE
jgi:hypothetical protein